ncbi:hypothetical protein L615_000700000630 [Nocardioides sp. J9]|uniref:MarR family winged helix-turn-helix transcriptional regulator n=1 Tax=unclassified Nocardioides TaxID=2615069 RepID=UPI0004916405|nr:MULTISPECIES: MarR family winged helix-turn-helix transcriptional regulator [unclassified Nocardioides]TWG92656.1 hypothetical protein L615_000700000630 [Nocardioides sp. J9]
MTAPRPLPYWTSTVSRLIDEQVEDAVAAAGLTRPQWRVLDRLASGSVQVDDAPELLSPYAGGQAPAEVLDSLVADGLAEELSQEYRLTPAGHERVDELRAGPVQAVADRATADLSPEEHDALLDTLERIARSLGWLGD